ncbi:MAG: hypothetical protein OET63_12245 [Desulfobacterales bacterium]|jgi:hypothetical protein|nr:hypothetical protein [Desulfobacterales bacterium]
MSNPVATQTKSISTQLDNNKTKIRNVEDHEAAAIYDEKKLRVVRGIAYSILFSIPFWLIVIMLVIWLVQN